MCGGIGDSHHSHMRLASGTNAMCGRVVSYHLARGGPSFAARVHNALSAMCRRYFGTYSAMVCMNNTKLFSVVYRILYITFNCTMVNTLQLQLGEHRIPPLLLHRACARCSCSSSAAVSICALILIAYVLTPKKANDQRPPERGPGPQRRN